MVGKRLLALLPLLLPLLLLPAVALAAQPDLSLLTKLYVPSWGVAGPPSNDDNGGSNCAACQIVLTLLMQYADMHDKPVVELLDEVCFWLPEVMQPPCKTAIDTFAPLIIELLEKRESPVVICRQIKICYGEMCVLDAPIPYREFSQDTYWSDRLLRTNEPGEGADEEREVLPHRHDAEASTLIKRLSQSLGGVRTGVSETPWQWIIDRINNAINNAVPFEDVDGDGFSVIETLRGTSWRGKDCNDLDKTIYPGRKDSSHPPSTDHNCNGIKGTSPSGVTYEDLLCGETPARGSIVLGDSAAAHFHIPPQVMHAASLRPEIFEHILFILENEIDWPQLSAYTGYTNTTYGLVEGPTNSLYSLMLERRNRCNHRDYQNIAHNGARAKDVAEHLVYTMSRTQQDNPALVVHALIGNDVCSGRAGPNGTMDHFTSPQDFEAAVLKTLDYLDTHLAPNSSVVFIGLADGRILWDTMHALQHPIGATYANVYELLLCLDANPCFGWLNPNEAYRNATSAQAALLSDVYPKIMAEHKYKNFDMAYYSFVDLLEYAIHEWTAAGGDVRDLIEPIDGFHPSQLGLELIAERLYSLLEKNHPDMLGALNPHNSEITMLFGDQGGY